MSYEGGYYHVYNRGVDKRKIFLSNSNYERFLMCLGLFNSNKSTGGIRNITRIIDKAASQPPRLAAANLGGWEALIGGEKLVDVLAYCLLPNHFHLLLKELDDKGLQRFLSKLGNGYTKYFNTLYDRSGFLFQGKYKKKKIENDDYLLYLSAYINGNPQIHGISKARKWRWSSLDIYLDKNIAPEQIESYFYSKDYQYKDYLLEVINNSKSIKEEYKKLIIE